MAFITISDETGDMEAVLFPEIYRDVSRWLNEETLVMLEGKIESRNNRIQWLLSEIGTFDEDRLKSVQQSRLFIKLTGQNSETALEKIKTIANLYPGSISIIIHHEKQKKTYQLANNYSINANYECLHAFRSYFGKENVVFEK